MNFPSLLLRPVTLSAVTFAMLSLDASDARAAETEEHSESLTDHVAFSMGFLGAARNYGASPFEVQDGSGARFLGPDPSAPFHQLPFTRLPVAGLRYDTRLVISGVRMTAGFDFPFASGTVTHADLGGIDRTITLASLRPYELRFGIGYEAPTKKIVPFIDLMGGVHWTSASLLVDGEPVRYSSTAFAYSVRAGVRIDLRKAFFAAAAAELGLGGDVRWGGELVVGFKTF
jgi:hypothetical protein